jgi:hypothetical protein
MKRSLTLLVVTALALGATGCSAVYTSISKQQDGSYLVTRTKAGVFSSRGSLLRCTEAGGGMTCKEIAGPE